MKKRVVITGMGAITPLGNNVEDFWSKLKAGSCAVDYITAFNTEDFKVKIGAEVKNFNPSEYMDRRDEKRMDRFCQFAIAASKQAVENADINLDKINKERFAVIVGSGIGGMSTFEESHKALLTKGPNRVSPLFIPMMISNMAAGNIAIKYGAKGMCTSVSTACATGTNAIGDAFRLLQNGYADIAITGGSEAAVTPIAVAGFSALQALSLNEDPKRASIPFDAERSGFVLGEGSGILVIETLEHAKKRNAKILAEITGYGATCDAYHMTLPAPEGEGGCRAMKLAIQDSGINIEQISYINAHGTGTIPNDKFETAAIKGVFGEYAYKIPVNSTKSMIGHLLGGAGAVEAIVCAKSLIDGYVHPTIGFEKRDPECDLDYVPNKGREVNLQYALSNSLGFGGHNATLVLKKWCE